MGEEDDCIAGLFDFIVNFQRVIEYPELIAPKVSHIYVCLVKKMRKARFLEKIAQGSKKYLPADNHLWFHGSYETRTDELHD